MAGTTQNVIEPEPVSAPPPVPPVPPPLLLPPTLPVTPLSSLINSLLQQEMSNLDDEGFDMREYEEAIHRSLDDTDEVTAHEAASGDIDAMREMRLTRLEEKNNEDPGTSADASD